MKFLFVGHVSVDKNVVRGKPELSYGGGSLYGAITAQRLGADSAVFTKCAASDWPPFLAMAADAGVQPVLVPSATSTSIQNVYPTENPDDRQSRMVSWAEPFSEADIDHICRLGADWVHVNPLWLGEFPPELTPLLRSRVPLLSYDAGGLLRAVNPDGSVDNRDHPAKREVLAGLDLLKVDIKEAAALTGEHQPHCAARAVRELGPKIVLLTYQEGVCAFEGKTLCESPWTAFTMEGRTGRGDTCTASFLVAHRRGSNLQEATAFAADVTSRKMQYRGPFQG